MVRGSAVWYFVHVQAQSTWGVSLSLDFVCQSFEIAVVNIEYLFFLL